MHLRAILENTVMTIVKSVGLHPGPWNVKFSKSLVGLDMLLNMNMMS